MEQQQHSPLEELRKRLRAAIGKRVAGARTELNKTQPDLIEELKKYGMERTQGSVSQIENGKRLPSLEALYVIANFLDTSTDYLLGLTPNQLSAADIEEELNAAKGEGKINRLMRKLPTDRQQQILDYAEYLLSLYRKAEGSSGTSSQLPLTERQRNTAEVRAILDSVEKKWGTAARRDLEASIRQQFSDGNA